MPWNSVVRLTDRPDITIAVYRGRKAKKKPNKSIGLKYTYVQDILQNSIVISL